MDASLVAVHGVAPCIKYRHPWSVHTRDNVTAIGSKTWALVSVSRRRTTATFVGPTSIRCTTARMISRLVSQTSPVGKHVTVDLPGTFDPAVHGIIVAVLAWQLGAMVRLAPRAAASIGWGLCVVQVVGFVLSWIYFSVGPAMFSLAAAACLGLAAWRSEPRGPAGQPAAA